MADGAKSSEVHIDETDWEYEHETKLVDEDLELIADRLRADETKKMVNAVEVRSSVGHPSIPADDSGMLSANCWSLSRLLSASQSRTCGTGSCPYTRR